MLRNDSNIISRGFVAKNDYLGNGTIQAVSKVNLILQLG